VQGTNRNQLLTPRCVVCGKVVALRVDPEDSERWRSGMFAQDAFADESGVPYLSAAEREMLISATCGDCYERMCPNPISHPTAYN
jgi:hypothetical protein